MEFGSKIKANLIYNENWLKTLTWRLASSLQKRIANHMVKHTFVQFRKFTQIHTQFLGLNMSDIWNEPR